MKRLLLLIFSLMLYVNGWGQCTFNGPGSMNLNISGGNTICPYENITVDVTQAQNGSTYLWSTGATTASISASPAITTTYTVTVTCPNGTTTQSITANVSNVSVGINATVNGNAFNNPNSITINCGQSVNLAGFGVGGNNNDYDWLFPNIPNDQTITVNPTQTTSYFLVGTGNGNCKDTDTIVVNVNPLNNAAFSFLPNNACSGVPIQFTNGTLGPNLNYSWNFNDGTPNSSQVNPIHVFNSTGTGSQTYNVVLTVTPQGSGGGCSQTVTHPVTIYQKPDAALDDPFSSVPFQNCGTGTFDLNIINASSTISTNTNYYIDWGDGTPVYNSSTLSNSFSSPILHQYTGSGYFTITHIVTGPNGCVDTAKYIVFNGTNPAVGLYSNGSSVLQCIPATDTIYFSGITNNPIGTTYTISINDGTQDTILIHPPPPYFIHTFNTTSCGATGGFVPNSFIIKVKAENPCGTSFASFGPVTTVTPPDANFSISNNPSCVNSVVTFTNTSLGGVAVDNAGNCNSNNPLGWKILPSSGYSVSSGALGNTPPIASFGGGSQALGVTFNTPGIYAVTLYIRDTVIAPLNCRIDSITKTICIVGPPIPSFTSTPSLICAPDTLFLNNTSTLTTTCDVPTYNWTISNILRSCPADSAKDTTFVNNTSLTSFNPNVIFNNQGDYKINLSVTNVCGTFNAPPDTITVKRKPIASFNVQPSICVNQSVNLATTFQGCGDTTRFYWTIPGGSITSSTAQNPGAVTFANPGTYIIKDSVVNSCGAVVLKDTLVVYPLPVPVVRGDTICVGQQAVVVASGGTSYLWSNGSTNDTLFVSPASTTTYTVTVTNANSCSATATTTVLVNPLPTPIATGSTVCSGLTTTITGSGGGTYLWSTGAITQNINVILTATATYTLTVTNSFGCTASDTAIVTIQPLPLVNAGPSITLCNQPIPTTLTGFSPTGGTWSGTSVTSSGVFTPSGTGVFVLTYTFTDANGCINNDTMRVTVITPQVANAGTGFHICQSNASVNLTGFTPAGGTWSGTNVTSAGVFTPSQLGQTILTYTYGAGTCLNTDTIRMTVDSLPNTIAIGGTVCSNQPILISGSGGGTYLWSTGAITQNINATLSSTATYTLTVTNILGCTASDTAIVTILPLPVVNAGLSITLCDQPIPTTLTGFSPTGGTWSGTGVTSGGVFTPNGIGVFVLTYTFTDANGCTNNDTMRVTVITPQLANAGTGFSTCQSNTSINLIGFSPAGGTWSGTNVTSAGVFTPSQLGQTILTYTYGAGTCINTDTIQITVNPLPTITSNSGSICPGGSVTLTASGGVSYTWNTTPVQNTTSITVSPVTNTNYIVTGTDANGCSNTSTSSISLITAPIITSASSQSICSGNSSSLAQWTSSLGAGTTYTWVLTNNTNVNASGVSQSSGTGDLLPMTLTTTGSSQGILQYTVTPTGNGCTGRDTIYKIIVNPLPNVSAGSDKTICSGLSATLNGSSTTSSVSYLWSPSTGLSSNSVATPTVSLISGTAITNSYVLTVTDANSCTKTDTVLVNVNPLPTITSNSGSICPGGNITLTASGGVSYSWNTTPVQNTSSISVSPATNTNYIVTGTDTNGCVNKDTSTVSLILAPIVTNTSSQTLCSGNNSSLVQWTSSLGPGTTYTWVLTNNTNVNASGVSQSSGTGDLLPMTLTTTGGNQGILQYTVTPTGNGCTGRDTIYKIIVNPLPNVSAGSDKTICSGLSATLNGSSTTSSVSYSWSPSIGLSSNSVATPTVSLTAGTAITNSYVLTVTDGNTCTKTDTVLVNVNPLPTISSNSGSICPGGNITLTASGGVSYSWNTLPVQNTSSITVNPTTNTDYIVTGTDTNGCVNKDTSVVSIISAPSITNPTSDTICSESSTAIVQWTSNLGVATVYNWSLQSNSNVVATIDSIYTVGSGDLQSMQLSTTGNLQGTLVYTATATGNGCVGLPFTYTIYVNPLPNVSAGSDKTICSGLSATLNGSSNTSSVSYSWSPSTGLSSNSVATPTVSLISGTAITNSYVLTVTDANSCTKTDTVLVNVNPLPTITSNSGSICPGGSITLTAIGGVSYSWNTSPVQNTSSITVNPTTNTDYIVTGTDTNGCVNKDTSVVSIISAPSITSPTSETICSESNSSTVQWTSNLGVATVYNWTLQSNTNVVAVIDSIYTVGTGDLSSMQLSTTGSVQGTLVYTATATGNGCVGVPFTYTIYVTPLPLISVAIYDTTICSKDTVFLNFSSQISNTTYTWTAILGDSIISVPTTGSGNAISQVLTNTGTDLDSVVYTITPRANNCDGLPINVTVYVQPIPHVTFSSPNQVLCDSSTTSSVTLNSTVANVVYSWSLNANGITGFVNNSGAGTILSETIYLPPNATANVSAIYTASASIDGCPGPDSLYSVTLYPIANITGPNDQTICSGQNISPVNWTTNVTVPTTFIWQIINIANTNVGGYTSNSGFGNIPAWTLTNPNPPNPNPDSLIIQVTPYTHPTPNDSCQGIPYIYTIVVNPAPSVNISAPNDTICSGGVSQLVGLSTQTNNAIISWVAVADAQISGLVNFSGTDTIFSETLFNSDSLPHTVHYTINIITSGILGCPGVPQDYYVVVNPSPLVTFNQANQVICSGSSTLPVVISTTSPNTLISWTASPSGILGLSSNSGGDTIPSFNLVNNTFSPITITFAAWGTTISENCVGDTNYYTITVNPIPPAFASPSDTTICSNTAATIQLSSPVAGTTFSWTYGPNPFITGASNGSGNTITQTLVNSDVIVQTMTYYITPNASNCPGSPITATVNVNPAKPVIFNPGNQSLCSNETSIPVYLSSPISGVTYSWTCTPPSGITGAIASGTDSIPSQNLFSTSTVTPIPVIYNAIATFDGCPGPITPYTITVNPTPVPSFTLDTVICKNVTYVFGNTTSTTANTTYTWDFGDGSNSTATSPSHAYNAGGVYTIILVATNQYGCDSSYIRTVRVVEPPVAQFVESPREGCGPLSVTFTDQSTGYLINPTYNWNFGNGTTANTQGPHTVIYNASLYQDTLYLVTQTVGNLCGSTTYIDSVLVHPTPTAYFGTNLSSGCSPLTISFSNNSYGLPTSFLWNFGDGTTDTSQVPAPHTFYAYTQDTIYYISLIAINDCGTNTYVDSVLVHPNTTNAFFNTSPDRGCAPLTVTFTNFSTGGNIYAWNFGDGNVSNQYNTTHTYVNPGTYTASFVITNNCSYDTAYVSIEVWPQPTLSFISSIDTVCINSSVQFTNTSATPLTNIVWDFGDGSGSVLTNPQHTYSSAGTFLVSMIGTGGIHGCSDTTYKYIVVKPLPIANYDSLYFEGCQPYVANFINLSTGGVSGVLWDFGDGNTSAAFNASHVYLNAGIFYPLLTVQTQYGCIDTARGEVIVHPKPTSIFTFSPDSACGAPVTVQFNNQSLLGSGANWSFTDGQTSTQISPAMNFTQVGTIGAQLIAISDFGCKDTSSDQFVVYPEPIADIAVVDPSGCEDFTPIFINNSTNAVSYLWTFGDGFVSTDQTPKHTYVNDGNYQVSLVIEGVGGCKDSAALNNQIVVLPGPTADFSYTPALNPSNYGWVYFTNLSTFDVNWLWDFDDNNGSTLENPDHQFNANGVYNVELIAYSANGCTDTIVKPIKPTYFDGLFVPNAFAPDRGSIGELYRVFYPQGKSLSSYHVWVYDMFGILIWESTALDNGSPSEWWDGTRDGSPLPSDVYIWKVEATFENGDKWPGQYNPEQGLKRITGNVSLIR